MQGPPLTTHEIASRLVSSIASLEADGLSRRSAVDAVARKYNVERARVQWLLGQAATDELVEASRWACFETPIGRVSSR
jgi:hypothetical protein